MNDENGIILYGGTFDPIHNGHLIIARSVSRQLGVSKVILIPSAQPPHKPDDSLSAAQDRFKMTQLAVACEDLFEVSDCELLRQGPSYTLDTVRHFRQQLGPGVILYWLIGADTVRELASWYQISHLADECTIVTALRPGFDALDFSTLRKVLRDDQIARLKEYVIPTPLIAICATDIRRAIAEDKSIKGLIPLAVEDYILKKGLYRP